MAERRRRAAGADDYEQLVLGLRDLGADAFAELTPRVREALRRYYGLDGPAESQAAPDHLQVADHDQPCPELSSSLTASPRRTAPPRTTDA